MIKARELRIGNMVMFMGREIIVHGGTIQDLERGFGESVASQYEPIPLTPEILEKAGFEKYVISQVYSFKLNDTDLLLVNLFDNSRWIDNGEHFGRSAEHAINYLHQLQNLVSALTGKELEITL